MFRKESRCCQCDEFFMKAIVVTKVSLSFIDSPPHISIKKSHFSIRIPIQLHTTQHILIENVSLSEGDPMIEW